MTENSRQKIKYLENEKSFYDEMKSIFHHLQRAFIEANEKSDFDLPLLWRVIPHSVTIFMIWNAAEQKYRGENNFIV